MNKSLLLILLISINSFAAGYHARFWRGESRKSYPELRQYCDDQKQDCFKELLNRWLIPATSSYAAKDSLLAYAPVLMPKYLQQKYHDEIALIVYNSKDIYRSLRNGSKEGKTYGPIHGDVFDIGVQGTKKSSRTVVGDFYNNNIVLKGNLKEVSYDVYSSRNDLVNSNGLFQLIERKSINKKDFLNKSNKYLQEIKKNSLAGAYVLVTEDYVMTYLFFYNDIFEINMKGLQTTWGTKLKKIAPIQRSPLLYDSVDYGEGANMIFTPGVKPGMVDHYRLYLP